MRGHITKRGNHSYSIAISLGRDPATGKYKCPWTSVKGTRKEAEKRLSELLHQLDTGTLMKSNKTTVVEYVHPRPYSLDQASTVLSISFTV